MGLSPPAKSAASYESASDAATLSRLSRDRARVVVLIAGACAGLLLFLATTVLGTLEVRDRTSLERTDSTARLCAQLLTEQCDSAFDVLQTIAHNPPKDAHGNATSELTLSYLHNAVELIPDLQAAAVYRPDGALVEYYPKSVRVAKDVRQEGWYQHAVGTPAAQNLYVGGVTRIFVPRPTDTFTAAIPLGSPSRHEGYLLAYFRLGDLYKWMQTVRMAAGAVFVVDGTNRVVAASGPGWQFVEGEKVQIPADYPALPLVQTGTHGALLARTPALRALHQNGGQAVVGYAFASRLGWSVLVVEPVGAAYAPTEYLLKRFLGIAGILMVLLPVTGWAVFQLYSRQETLTRALARQNTMLDRANRAKSDLLANVSHDLKTPIASMQLSISGLLEDMRPAADSLRSAPGVGSPSTERTAYDNNRWEGNQVEECLTLVNHELDQLASRVRNLLDMARLDSDIAPPFREPCDLTDIVATVLERVRPLLAGRPVQASFPPVPLLVECDPTEMETVVLNLVENALKYTPPGSPLYLGGAACGGDAMLWVRDTGPGVAPGDEERIFEKFYRTTTPHAVGGTGLGLAICKTIVEAHGGAITARSIPDGGAQFTIILPAAGGEDSFDQGEETL